MQKLKVCHLLVGTYTSGGSDGIYGVGFDYQKVALTEPRLIGVIRNPSFLAMHPHRACVYAVSEISDYDDEGTGGVVAFGIKEDGALTKLNSQSSGGPGPCHIAVDKCGCNVVVANYGGGSLSVLPIYSDGRLAPNSDFIQLHGKGARPDRQSAPHAHSINLDRKEEFALVPDLGTDRIMIYRFDAGSGHLVPGSPPFYQLPAGAGPRHLTFHFNGRLLFVANELSNTVTAMEFDSERGALKELQTISTLPANGHTDNLVSEVAIHPTGRFLYVSNRGHDSIAIFRISQKVPYLNRVGFHPSGGRTPRHFAIDRSGKYLFVANQDSHRINLHRIDVATGMLTDLNSHVEISMPSSVIIRG